MLVFFALLFPLALPAAEQYNKNFSFELRDVTVKDIFRYIEQNSEYVFLYASNKNLSKKVNVDVKDKNVKQILDEVLEHTKTRMSNRSWTKYWSILDWSMRLTGSRF